MSKSSLSKIFLTIKTGHMSKTSLSKIISITKIGHSVLVAVLVINFIAKDEKGGKKKKYSPVQNTEGNTTMIVEHKWLENRTVSKSFGILDKKWAVHVTGQMEDMIEIAAVQKPPQNQL